MSKNNLESTLFLISGILFFIAAIIGKNLANVLFGCSFTILGISRRKKDNK